MQQNNDITSPYYPYYPQNPDPNFPDPINNNNYYNHHPFISQASAPPISPNSHRSNHFFQQTPDHFYPNPNPQFSDSPNPPPSFLNQPPLSYYPYDQSQNTVNYDDPISSISHQTPNYDPNSYGGYGDQFSGGDGVYRYNGGKVEGFVGLGSRDDSGFDDYGRPIITSVGNGNEVKKGSGSNYGGNKVVRAVPKIDGEQDVARVGNGVQKFRVRILAESVGQTEMDVLCQIGLDGIRILEPASSRILKVYQLETVSKWEVLDSYIFAFWVQSSIDIEPRRIRLKSNSYTTNNILDTVAAASIQLKEMVESSIQSNPPKESESEKKKGFDWMNLVKLGNEEKDHWVPDEAVSKCTACRTDFGAFVRRHHCRNCGDIFCDKCTQGRIGLTADESAQPVRVCDSCMTEVTQRLSNAKEVTAKISGLKSHEDLAKKLQEVMDKNRKAPTGIMPIGYDTQTREVECPTCTVHLQVKVPASGSETIECSVCRHPFLVSAQ